MENYQLLPARAVQPVAYAVIVAEIALGALLWVRPGDRIVLVLTMALVCVFGVAMAINLARRRTVSCGCIGTFGTGPISTATLMRTALLAGLTLVLIVQAPRFQEVPPQLSLALAAFMLIMIVQLAMATRSAVKQSSTMHALLQSGTWS